MKTIRLTDKQMQQLYKELAHVEDNGLFELDVDVDENTTVHAIGSLETQGYYEDDYYNGTGAYVVTQRDACIHLTATLYDNDGDCEEVAIDDDQRKEAEAYMIAA